MDKDVALILNGLRISPETVQPWKVGWLWRIRNDNLERIWTCLSSPQTLTCSYLAQAASHLGEYVLKGQVASASAVGPKETRGMISSLLPPSLLHGFRVGASSVFASEMEYTELYAEAPEVMLSWISAIESCRPPSSRPLLLSDRYELDLSKPLGTGLFAVVVRAKEHSSGQDLAIKVIRKEAYREFRPMIQREFSVWSCAGTAHPNICGLADAFTSATTAFFVAELCKGGGLIKWLARCPAYSESDACLIMRQILEALDHLHSMKLNHSDLKPENICMATRGDPHSLIRLIDFSMASFFGTPMDPGGTPEFVAPELLNDPEYYAHNGCGPAVDMWSAGIVLYFLLSGQTPFAAPNVDAIVSKVQSGLIVDGPKSAFRGQGWYDVSDGAKDLIRCLLRTRREERPSARDALSHPWIQTGSLMGLPRRPLEAAKKMFRSQAVQAGEDISSPFPPLPYSPSSQSQQPSSSSPPQLPTSSFLRSQSARYSETRDMRQKGSTLSILSSVPEQKSSESLHPYQAPRPAQRFSASGSASMGNHAALTSTDVNRLNMANVSMGRRSQSLRHDDVIEDSSEAPFTRSSLPPVLSMGLPGSHSTPTRSTPPPTFPSTSAIPNQAGPSDVIQMLRQELAGLQGLVIAKKRSTISGLPTRPLSPTRLPAPYVSPSHSSSLANDLDMFSAAGPGPSKSSRTPSSAQLSSNLPEPQVQSASQLSFSAMPNESIVALQQQLRELQMMAAEKASTHMVVGGSERGPRETRYERRRTDNSSSSMDGTAIGQSARGQFIKPSVLDSIASETL